MSERGWAEAAAARDSENPHGAAPALTSGRFAGYLTALEVDALGR